MFKRSFHFKIFCPFNYLPEYAASKSFDFGVHVTCYISTSDFTSNNSGFGRILKTFGNKLGTILNMA